MQDSSGHQVVVLLRPTAEPAPPLAESFTYGQGWHQRPEDGWQWAFADAALSYFNPYPNPIAVDLRFDVVGATPRELLLEREGRLVGQLHASDTPTPHVLPQVSLAPGVNRFKLRSTTRPVRNNEGRNQLRSFGMHGVSVRPCEKQRHLAKPATTPSTPKVSPDAGPPSSQPSQGVSPPDARVSATHKD
jgi:hypothetical protein